MLSLICSSATPLSHEVSPVYFENRKPRGQCLRDPWKNVVNTILNNIVGRWPARAWLKLGLVLCLGLRPGLAGAQSPTNDNFANAIILSGLSGSAKGTNVNATLEPPCETNQVNCADDGPQSVDQSVWYAWTAPGNVTAAFNTVGSGFDTVLSVWTTTNGLCDATLTNLVSDDDTAYNTGLDTNNFTSSLSFSAVAGTTYYISVAGNALDFGNDAGKVVLNWTNISVTPVSSGTFQFTTNKFVVSDLDSTFPNANDGNTVRPWPPSGGQLGGRLTVTRVGGSSGRVFVDYFTTSQTYTNIFTTNYFGTNISYTLVNTNGVGWTTNVIYNFIVYSNSYPSYINGGYVNYVVTGASTNIETQIFNQISTALNGTNYPVVSGPLVPPPVIYPPLGSSILRLTNNIVGYGTNITVTTVFSSAVTNQLRGTNAANGTTITSGLVTYTNFATYWTNNFTTNYFGTNIYTAYYQVGGSQFFTNYYYTNLVFSQFNFTNQVYTNGLLLTNLYSSGRTLAAVTNFAWNITNNVSGVFSDVVGPTGPYSPVPTSYPPLGTTNVGYATNYDSSGELIITTTNTYRYPLYVTTAVVPASGASFFTYSNTLVFDDYQMSQDIMLPVRPVNSATIASQVIGIQLANPRLDTNESADLLIPTLGPTGSNATVSILNSTFPSGPSVFNIERSAFTVYKYSYTAGTNSANKIATITVYRTGSLADPVSVDYTIDPVPPLVGGAVVPATFSGGYNPANRFKLQAGSDYATVGSDFTSVSGTLSWGVNDANPKTLTIPILNNGLVENNADLLLQLYNPLDNGQTGAGAVLGMVNSATLTILYDESTCGQQPAGAVDRCWNKDGFSDSIPPDLQYPGTQGGVSGGANGNGGTVYAVAEQPDGKAIVAGSFISFDSNPYNRIVRLLNNGYQDPTFLASPNSGANNYITCLALQPDGKILIGGNFTSFNGANRFHIARLNTDGNVDPSFNPGLGANGMVVSLALQTNGQVVIAGQFTQVNGTNLNSVARLNADGTVDASFNPGVGPDGLVNAVVVDPSGRVIIGGEFDTVAGVPRGGVARFNVDGSLDAAFDPGIGTYNPDSGSTDPVYSLALQPDGRLLVGGAMAYFELATYNGLVRLSPDGTVDTSFNPGTGTYNPFTGVADSVNAITLQPDGRILIGGDFTTYNQTRRVGIARLFSFGSLDTSFMDTYYNQFAGLINHYHNPNAVNPSLYPPGNNRNFVDAIALEPGTTNANVIIGGGFLRVGGGYYREDVHPRSNVARLIGGSTPGPGNIELSYNKYSVDSSAGQLFVSLIRTNGSLGPASALFSTNMAAPGPGVATGDDFSLTTNYTMPTWPTLWSLSPTFSWMKSPAVYGPNYLTTPVVQGQAYVYLNINNNSNITGNVNANLALSRPDDTTFFLGGEKIPLGVALGWQDTAPLTIIDDNFLPGVLGFSSSTYTVNENAGTATITVVRTNFTGGVVQVSYATTNGSAVSPTNYTATSGTLTFQAGDASKSFTIPIINGTIYQPDTTVNLQLNTPAGGATLGRSNAVLTIVNQNSKFGHLGFVSAAYNVNENAGTALIGISRLGGSVGTLNVTAFTADGTATNGVNYLGVTTNLTWNSGDVSTRYVAVPVLHDGIFTSNLTVNLLLTNGVLNSAPNNAVVLGYGGTNAVLNIVNVDFPGQVQFTAGAYSIKKYAGSALIPVIRTGGSAGTVTVKFNTVNGYNSAQAGVNYTSTSGTLTFANGEVSKYFNVPITAGATSGLVYLNLILTNALVVGNAIPWNALGTPSNAVLNIIDTTTVNEVPGQPDVTYSPYAGFNNAVYAFALQPNNQLLAGGDFTMADGVPRQRLARLNSDGSLDANFSMPSSAFGADASVRALVVQEDGRILVGGYFTNYNSVTVNGIARLNNDGSLDSTFNAGSGANSPVFALGETYVGGLRKILVGGAFASLNGQVFNYIGRLNDDGTPDLAFNAGGLGANGTVYALAVQSDGKVLIGGDFTAFNNTAVNHIARLNVDGTLDLNFTNAIVNIAAGANGSVRAITLQSDGKILIGGAFTSVNGTALNRIARLNLDGSLDGGFTPGAGADDQVLSIALQTDERIVVGGQFTHFSGVTRNRITRLNPSGTVDPAINFGPGANDFVAAIAVQEATIAGYPANVPDEKLIIGGGFTQYFAQPHAHLARIYGGAISGVGAFEFSSPTYQVNENGANVLITVIRTGGTSGTNADGTGDIFVPFATANGTALAGINYSNVAVNLDFPAGEVIQTVTIPVKDDGIITPNLTVNLSLNPVAPAAYGDQPTAVLTIVNVDSSISFSSSNYQVAKNVPGSVKQIDIFRLGSTVGTATVLFSTTTSGTALPFLDYYPQTNVLVTFNPGVSDVKVPMSITNNTYPEGNQTVGLQLANAIGSALFNPSNAVLTIIDTVQLPGVLFFSATNYSAVPTDGNAYVTVYRTNGFSGIVSVNYLIQPGSAQPGVDYNATGGLLTFAEGVTNRTITIPLVPQAQVKPPVSFSVLLSNAVSGATLAYPSNATVTISSAIAGISFVSATNVISVNSAAIVLNVQRLYNTNNAVSVNYQTADGTAVAGVNYLTTSGQLTFNSGQTLLPITVPLLNATNSTANLQFNVQLTNPTGGAQLLAPSNAVVIEQPAAASPNPTNLNAGTFLFTSPQYVVSDNESFSPQDPATADVPTWLGARVTVTRTNGSSGRVIVPYAVIVTNPAAFSLSGFGFGFNFTNLPVAITNNGTLVFDDYQMSSDIVVPISHLLAVTSTNGIFGTNAPSTNSLVPYAPPAYINVLLGTPSLDPLESSDLNPPLAAGGTNGTQTTIKVLSATLPVSVAAAKPVFFNIERATFRASRGMGSVTVYVYPSAAPTADPGYSVQYAFDHNASMFNEGPQYNTFDLQAGSDYAKPGTDFTDGSGGTLTWGQGDKTPKPITITIDKINTAAFNEDIEIELYNPYDNTTSPRTPLAWGQVHTATVTILFNVEPAGAVDQGWNPDGANNSVPPFLSYPGTGGGVSDSANGNGGTVYAVAEQPDGKAIVAGSFISFDSNPYNRIVRLLNNGYQDPTFLATPNSGANEAIYAMALQPDGRIVIGGNFTAFNGANRNHIARLNTDGTVDTTFNPGSGANGRVWAAALQSDGKIFIAGEFTAYNGTNCNYLARLNADGSLDTGFNPGTSLNGPVYALAVPPYAPLNVSRGAQGFETEDDNVVNLGSSTSGTLTVNYNMYSVPDDLRVYYGTTNGVLIFDTGYIPGSATVVIPFGPTNGITTNVVTIVMNQGGGQLGTVWDYTASIVTAGSTQVYAGGAFNQVSGVTYGGVARFNGDGTIDYTFAPGIGTYNPYTGATDPVYALGLQSDGKLIAGGAFSTVEMASINGITRFNRDGTVDLTFSTLGTNNGTWNPATGIADTVNAITLQSDGKIVFGGNFTTVNQTRRVGLARLFTDGSLDTSFMDTAYNQFAGIINHYHNSVAVNTNDYPQGNHRNAIKAIALEAGGNVIVGGNFLQVGGGSYGHSGSIDSVVGNNQTNGIINNGRMDVHPRSNVARLIGNTTTGPGNLEFSYNNYTVDKDAGTLYVSLLRLNGNLGSIAANFFSPPGAAGQPGIAIQGTNANFSIGNLMPEWDTTWSVPGWMKSAGFDGQNYNFNTGDLANETLTIYNNSNITGNLNANLALNSPNPNLFYLGGELIPLGAALGATQISPLTIIDNNFPAGTFGFSSPTYTVNESSNTVTITVVRTNGTSGSVSLSYATANGSAVTPANYTATSGTLTFNQGDTSKSFTVQIIPSTLNQPDKTVNLSLSAITGGGGYGLTNAVLTIVNNIYGAGHIAFAAPTNVVSETAGFANLVLNRLGASSGTLDVTAITGNGSAVNGVNYVGSTTNLHWNSGDALPKSMIVPVLHDGIYTSNLTVNIRLTNGLAGGFPNTNVLGLSSITNSTLVISNVDFPGTVEFTSGAYSVKKSAGFALIPVVRTGGSAGTVTVTIYTSDGSAHNGVNYTGQTNVLTFTNGQVSQSINVPITAGAGSGLVSLNLGLANATAVNSSLPWNAQGNPSSAVLNIIDTSSVNEPPGSPDITYSPLAAFNGAVYAFALQPNNQLLAGGDFTMADGVPRQRLARLNPDGTLDPTFSLPSSALGADASVRALALQTDGRILVGGYFTNLNSVVVNGIARLNYDGSLDSLFNPGSGADSPVLALGETFVGGLRKVLVGGAFASLNGQVFNYIGRLNDDGTPDLTFNPGGLGANGTVYALAVQTDGKVIIGGDFTAYNNTAVNHVARLNVDGTLDLNFPNAASNLSSGANGTVRAITLQLDGKILIGGAFTTVNGVTMNRIARLNSDGSSDGSFLPGVSSGGGLTTNAIPVSNNSFENPVVPGGSYVTGNPPGWSSALLSGTVDAVVNPGLSGSSEPWPVSPPPGLDAANFCQIFAYAPGGGGTVYQDTGVKYQAGATYTLTAAFGLQTNQLFATNSMMVFYNSALVPIASNVISASKLILGAFTNMSLTYTGTGFEGGNGDIIVGFSVPASPNASYLDFDNVRVTAVNPPAALGADDTVLSIALQTDERIVLGGQFTHCSGVSRNRITRLNPNGTVDPTINFGPGANDFVAAIAIQEATIAGYPANVPDEKIIIGGGFTQYFGQPYSHIARIYGGSVSGVGAFEFSSPTYQVNENGLNAFVTVIRTGGTSGTNADGTGDVYVPFATANGTALAGINYSNVAVNLDFPAGEVIQTVTIPVIDDGIITPNLTVNLSLNPVAPAAYGDQPTAVLTIINVDSSISFSSSNYQVAKNVQGGVKQIDIFRLGSTVGTSTVVFNTTTNGTALPGTDYTPQTNVLVTFNPGVSDVKVPVSVVNNGLPEGNQTVGLQLVNAIGSALVNPSNAVLTIIDTVQLPGVLFFSATNYAVGSSDGNAYLTVYRTNGSSGIVSVNYTIFPGTAQFGVDYTTSGGLVTFADGVTSRTITVPIVPQTVVKPPVSLSVVLTNAVGGASLGNPATAKVTISSAIAGISCTAATNTLPETSGFVNINVQRLNNTNNAVTVNYHTVNGSAVAGVNYTATSGLLSFTNGQTLASVLVPLINDTNVTGDLTFTFQLSNPTGGAQLLAPSNTVVVIQDADAGLYFTTNSTTVLKNAGNVTLSVVCSNPRVEPANTNGISVGYYTVDGTAKAGTDYQAASGTLVFVNGLTTNSFPVTIYNNNVVSGNKGFSVVLTNATAPGQITSPGTENVVIAESNAGLSFSQSGYTVYKNGGSATITVNRTGSLNGVVSVNYIATNGTAQNGINFVSTNGTLVFSNGVSSQAFSVPIIANNIVNPNLTVLLQLLNPVNAFLVPPSSAVLTILENGGSFVIPAGAQIVTNYTSAYDYANNLIGSNDTVQVLFGLRDSAGLNVTNLIAYLLATNGVLSPTPASQVYGPLIVYGHSVSRAYTFTARGTNSFAIAPTFALYDNAKPIGTAVFNFYLGTWTTSFANSNPIVILDNTNAAPYPSIINVSGVGGTLIKATVTLNKLTHTSPSDIDALVVAPVGTNTLIMAHAGGQLSVTNVTLTFDDNAANSLTQTTRLTTSTNKPTQFYPVQRFP